MMQSDNQNASFDPLIFIDELIEEMGMQYEDPEKLMALKENMLMSLNYDITQAVTQHIEPELIDKALDEHGEETDMLKFIGDLVKSSPASQQAIMDALSTFWNRTLHAHSVLVKNA